MKKVLWLLAFTAIASFGFASNPQTLNPDISFLDGVNTQYSHLKQSQLKQQASWQAFVEDKPGWVPIFDEYSGMPQRAFGPPIAVAGISIEAKAINFINNHLSSFGINTTELEMVNMIESPKYHYVHFKQVHDGMEVLWSELTLRFNKDGELCLFGADIKPVSNLAVSLSAADAIASAQSTITGTMLSATAEPEMKILAVPTADGVYSYKQVYQVNIKTFDFNKPGDYHMLVDGETGDVLYRQNRVHNCAPPPLDLSLSGTVTDNPLDPAAVQGLPHVLVRVGGTDYYTDANGDVTIPGSSTVTATIYLQGRYSRVRSGGGTTPSFTTTLSPGTNNISFDSDATDTELSAYYHVNQIHDFMRGWCDPGFNDMDFALETNVDLTSGDCNAFYDGSSINFYAPGGGCPATALFSDVIYHEYGHGINYDYYNYLGGSFGNGALGEGYADVWALALSGNPILGQGFLGSPGSNVRRYDVSPKRYPDDLVGEVHADGEIIAGAWWDLGILLGSIDDMMELYIETHNAVLNEPDGNEGVLYSNILLECLLADDDDGNLSNGTPNDTDILTAFDDMHGISLIVAAELLHTNTDEINEGFFYTVVGELNIAPSLLSITDIKLHYSFDRSEVWTTVSMSSSGPAEYTYQIPPQPKGTLISYYFEMNNASGSQIYTPTESGAPQPNLPYYTLVEFTKKMSIDFEGDVSSWTVNPDGSDNASTGIWAIGEPVGTGSPDAAVQPYDDHSDVGTKCAYTGNDTPGEQPGSNDVDDGKTSILSPTFNLTAYTNPAFTFYRWYSNNSGVNPGNDNWKVYITSNGVDFMQVERNPVSDASWRKFAFRVNDYVTPSANTQLLFVAEDSLIFSMPFDGGSIVEAAFDDIVLWDEGSAQNVGIEDINDLDLSLYPNPATEQLNITVEGVQAEKLQIKLYDAVGRLVHQANYQSSNNTHMLNVSPYSNGLYQLKLIANDIELYNDKVLINR